MKTKEKAFDAVGFMMDWETNKDMPQEEMVKGFQHLIDAQMISGLQGVYGRTAEQLIRAGLCHR